MKKSPSSTEKNGTTLLGLILKRRAKVGIMGLGYVGLPLACEFARVGFPVTGYDVDPAKVKDIARGVSYIPDVPGEEVKSLVRSGKLTAVSDPKALSAMDAVIICVPTPLRKSRDPDVSYIVAAVDTLRKNFRPGQLIILESTTYPGTTREIVLPVFAEGGKREVGRDFFLAFSPERVDPGNRTFRIRNTPKIVGGLTPLCGELARALYGSVVEKVVAVSSPEAAEMAKLLENTFRAVNIGLVNEVALMCDRLKLDAWEVINAAATKPFGFMAFYPGPGIGGHCIPLDPQYLSWKLKGLNFNARFIELADEINSHMPDHVVKRVGDALNSRSKSVNGSDVLVLGVTYKKDITDVRESPALPVIDLLRERGARVRYHDPFVPRLNGEVNLPSSSLTRDLLAKQDCVVIVTDHSRYALPIEDIVEASPLVVDCRNATKGIDVNGNVFKL